MSTPLVSIVTPSYNEVDYIEETLNSVEDQTYPRIEHIIIDGGSTDGTIDILEGYDDKYNMNYISEPDGGLYNAIAKGFKKAEGELLAWINANDLYFPWGIEIAVEHLNRDGINWVTGRSATLDEDGRLIHIPSIQKYYKREWIKNGWYHGKGLGWFCQPSMVWTTDLWNKSGGFPENIQLAGEHHLWREFANHADLHSINTIIGAHRKHSNQLSEDMALWYSEVEISIWEKLLGKLKMDSIYSLYKIKTN